MTMGDSMRNLVRSQLINYINDMGNDNHFNFVIKDKTHTITNVYVTDDVKYMLLNNVGCSVCNRKPSFYKIINVINDISVLIPYIEQNRYKVISNYKPKNTKNLKPLNRDSGYAGTCVCPSCANSIKSINTYSDNYFTSRKINSAVRHTTKYSYPQLIDKKFYSVADIFNMIHDATTNYRSTINIDGDDISINKTLRVFERSTKCVSCGIEGKYFVKTKADMFNAATLNLYAIDIHGNKVLMTKDHIKPKSLGGSNTYDNLQTMCVHCNNAKDNIEDIDGMWTSYA